MANLKALAKDTAIYGLSSIVGRFLNYLLVPLYTVTIPSASGGYGEITNVYAFTGLILVILTFGMETTFFRFANDAKEKANTVFSTALTVVCALIAVFLVFIFGFLPGISETLHYQNHPEWVWMMSVVGLESAVVSPDKGSGAKRSLTLRQSPPVWLSGG